MGTGYYSLSQMPEATDPRFCSYDLVNILVDRGVITKRNIGGTIWLDIDIEVLELIKTVVGLQVDKELLEKKLKGGEKTMREEMAEAGYADPLADAPSSLAEKVESIEASVRNIRRTINEIYGVEENVSKNPTEAAVRGSGIDALHRRLDMAIQQLYELREPLEGLKRKLIG